jgi:hypothetical protein
MLRQININLKKTQKYIHIYKFIIRTARVPTDYFNPAAIYSDKLA